MIWRWLWRWRFGGGYGDGGVGDLEIWARMLEHVTLCGRGNWR